MCLGRYPVFLVFAVFIGIGTGMSSALCGSVETLVITNPDRDFSWNVPVGCDDTVSIVFFHSYDRQWVEETFKICKGRFIPIEVRYADDTYDFRDTRYTAEIAVNESSIKITSIQPLPGDMPRKIITRIAYTVSQELIVRSRTATGGHTERYRFHDWGKPGQRLIFSISNN